MVVNVCCHTWLHALAEFEELREGVIRWHENIKYRDNDPLAIYADTLGYNMRGCLYMAAMSMVGSWL
jgi:hypothetical protein